MQASKDTIADLKIAHRLLQDASLVLGRIGQRRDFTGQGCEEETSRLLQIEKDCSKNCSTISRTLLVCNQFKH